MAGLLCAAAPAVAHAAPPPAAAGAPEPAEPARPAPSLIGDVVIFNDEIVEPVSAPISTCGPALLATGPSACADASRVSDDDA